MFCTNCGSQFEEGNAFCPNCGTKVESVAQPVAEPAPAAVPVAAAAVAATPVEAAPVAATPVEAAPVQATPVEAAPIQPAPAPAPVQPVYEAAPAPAPAPVQAAPVQPVYAATPVTPIAAAAPAGDNSLAKSVLTFGIMAVAFAISTYFSFMGIIFGIIGLNKAKKFMEEAGGQLYGKAKIGKYLSLGGLIGGCVITGIMAFYIFGIILGVLSELGSY